MTTVIDIVKKRGDTRRHTFVVKDGAGTVVPITAWTAFVLSLHTVKAPIGISTEVSKITGALSTDGSDGRVYFVPSGTLPIGKYYYDAQGLDANSEKITFVEGKYTIEQDRAKD